MRSCLGVDRGSISPIRRPYATAAQAVPATQNAENVTDTTLNAPLLDQLRVAWLGPVSGDPRGPLCSTHPSPSWRLGDRPDTWTLTARRYPGNGQQPATDHVAVPTIPSTFLCYRRADEPFATALLGTALIDRLGESRVFLDTVSLDRGRALEAKLIAAARSADVMLVVIGEAWDWGRNRERLDEGDDWVRTEILQADDAGRRIMLVLVERDPGPIDLPAALGFLRDCETVTLRRPDVSAKLAGIADTITGVSTAVPASAHLDPTTVKRATLAMIRHVLPDRQQFSGNDKAVARAVAEHLAPGEWLRFAGAGNSPGRPGGSGVVMVTDEQLRLVQLRPRRGLRFGVQTAEATSRPLTPHTTLRDIPRRSSSRDLVDVYVEAPGWEPLPVLGLFHRPAEILLEVAARASRRAEE